MGDVSAQTDKLMSSESFHAITLTHGLKNFGYTTAEAIADLIDNSIEANAKNIEIIFWEGSANPYVAIIDDGDGMLKDELENAIKIKKTISTSSNNIKLSKFGFGLKTASFSQCSDLTIITKKKNQTNFKKINSNLQTTETNLLSLLKKFPFVEKKFNQRCSDSGTVVIWDGLHDNLTGKNSGIKRSHAIFYEKGKIFSEHASTHFHNFLDKVKIYFNEMPIKNWDPFNESLENLKTFEEKKIKLGDFYITIKGYVYPKEDDFKNIEIYEKVSGPYGWFDSQGIYLYREKRLLSHGGWFGLRTGGQNHWQKETKYERCRITLNYDSQLDAYFKPNVQKTRAEIPPIIRGEVASYCEMVRKSSLEKRVRENKIIELTDSTEDLLVKNQDGKIEINLNHPNIETLLNKNLSATNKEFILSQLSKEIKKKL